MDDKASPIDIANERLARGEINSEEHARLINILKNTASAAPMEADQTSGAQHDSGLAAQPPVSKVEPAEPLKHASVAPQPVVAAAAPTNSSSAWLWFAGIAALVIVALVLVGNAVDSETGTSNSGATGLSIGQIEPSYNRLSLTLANTSTLAGDVLLYVTYDGIKKCEHVVEMRATSTITDLSFTCEINSSDDKFVVRYLWASNNPSIAAVAKRINVNW